MSPRARRAAAAAGVIVAAQAALVAAYVAVERGRGDPDERFSFERLAGSETAPTLQLEARDGAARTWRPGARPTLVHFWATWCAPCRTELPELLAAARAVAGETGFELVAVSVDDSWPAIETFFAGDVPPEVARARDPDAARRFGVGPLPDSFFVSAGGLLVARYRGARQWQAARSHLLELSRSRAR